MLHPPVEQLELGPRHPEEHREEEQRHGTRITKLQQLPGGPVDAIYDHIGGAERPTARQHHDERQHQERADDSRHEHEQRHGPEQRERHAPEALPGVRAVYASGVQVRLGNRPKAREEDRQLVAQLHPHGHEHHRAGLGPVNWLGDPKTALLAVMLVSVWMQLGYQLTVFLAGLRAIPQAYLDTARVDGANAWQRFWRVTFPLLRPVTLFVLVTGIIGAFQVLALVMVLTGGGPLGATDVIVYRIYRTAWELLQFGDASAMALLLFAVLFGVTWAQLKLLDRRVEHA